MKQLTLSNQTYKLSNSRELAYYDSDPRGETKQATIVLIHGYCGSSAYFNQLIPHLIESYRILAVDLFGHGKSDVLASEQLTLEEAASYIDEWLQGLQLSNVHLLGHSLGGYITLALAERQPAYLSSFGLLHSTALPDSDEAKKNRDKAIQTVQAEGVQVFVDGLAPKLFAKDMAPQSAEIQYIKEIGYTTNKQAVIQFAKAMQQRPDRQHVIAKATVPVLLVAGYNDQIIKPEAVFAASQINATQITINSAAHMGMIESSQDMAAAIDSFVQASIR